MLRNLALIVTLFGIFTAAAAPHVVTLRDYLGRNWDDELVHDRLAFSPGELSVPRAAVTLKPGGAVPAQVSDVEYHDDGSIAAMKVWFKVTLLAGATIEATIQPGASGPADSTLRVQESADHLELTTQSSDGRIGVRLPRIDRTWNWPAQAQDVAAPLEAVLVPSGRWVGKGRLEVPFTVKSCRSEILANGPLFAEARVTYTFDTGYWTFTARLIDGAPMAIVREELDTGFNHDQAWDEVDRYFTFAFTDGTFAPDQVFYGSATNDQPHLETLLKGGMPEIVKTVNIRGNWFASTVRGYELNLDKPEEQFYFSGYQSVLNRIGGAIRVMESGGDAIGFAALDTAWWRNAMSLRFRVTDDREFVVSMPLQVYNQEWSVDGYGRNSPNYTGKTQFVPETTARRTYGIMLSKAENEVESLLLSLTTQGSKLGAFPLDNVKEWQFEIADPMADAEWAAETQTEAAEILQTMRNRIELRRQLGNLAEFSMGYHYGYAKGRWSKIKDTIDDPTKLTAEDRAEMRRLAIFDAYDQNSMNTFPWGTGFHLNNPNMSIMALEARVKSSLPVKDHPMFAEWGEWSLEFLKDYIRRFTFDSGALYENVHYSVGVTLSWAAQVNQILMDAGIGDGFDTDLFKRSMRFTLDWLTPPDPRFLGHRVAIPFGNSSYQSFPPDFANQFVGYYKDRDPELAGKLQWAANQTLPEDKQVSIVEEVIPKLESVHYGNYGVTFRHGFGTPYETMFAMLAGDCHGHYEWEQDQMSYTLYAKGQPINLHFGNGYFPMFGRSWLRNRVSIDMSYEKSERNPTQVMTASFTPEAEYLRASRGIDMLRKLETEYPLLNAKGAWSDDEKKSWPAVPEWTEIPMTLWYRQVIFMKDADPRGPNYFVIRDGFGGTPTRPTEVSYWMLSKEMQQEGDLFHFEGQADVNMDLFLHTPQGQAPETGEHSHVQQPYVRLVGFDPAYHPDGKLQERQQLIRWRQEPGDGYMVVLYPRLKENDPPATFTRLADSAVRIETPLSTDYVFLAPHPFDYADDRVAFSGLGGSIRFYKDGRTVIVNTDGDASFAVDGKRWSGTGAFMITLADGKAASTLHGEGASVQAEE